MRFGQKAIEYFTGLEQPRNLPESLRIMNPYRDPEVRFVLKTFYEKFYNDSSGRIFIMGINPGRFGGGTTGIAFTDPVNLNEVCGINNSFAKRSELSSRFIYKVIESFGTKKFFESYFMSALFPLAIIKNDKNRNYYDDKRSLEFFKPKIAESLIAQVDFGAVRDFVVCLGKKNTEVLREINNKVGLFKEIRTLEHPRYIMQYKHSQINSYVTKYLNALKS